MPKFQITDPQSGKTVTIEGATMPSQTDAESIFHQAGLRPQTNQTTQPSAMQNVMDAGANVGNTLFGNTITAAQKTAQQAEQLPASQPGNLKQSLQNAATQTGNLFKNTVMNPGVISDAAGLVGDVGLFKGVTKLPTAVKAIGKYATKGTTYKAMENAASKGTDINWEDLSNQARTLAANKSTPTKQALEKLLQEQTPTGNTNALTAENAANYQIGQPNLTSPQALQLRIELGKRLPSSFFEKLTNKTPQAEKDATGILRNVVSSSLKKAAPGIKNADKIYSLYSKYGSPPQWAKRAVVHTVAKNMGLSETATDTIEAILALGGQL